MSRAKELLDLIESENPLQFWSMTKAEYEAKHGKPRKNTTGTGGFSTHKSAVEIALNQGKPVPAEVLKDYPELKLKYPELKGESYDEDDNIEIDQEPNKIKRLANIISELANEYEITSYKDYSGRGMNGAKCYGIRTTRHSSPLIAVFKKNKITLSRDSLGMGHILYWPEVSYEEIKEFLPQELLVNDEDDDGVEESRSQSLLTEEGQGTEYKLRAEFFGDILELFKKKKLQMSAYTITCKFQPDVELEMTSTASLDEIKKILRTITDSHVMLETVALKSEYTGDRKHED